jgi:HEAT repeat protein
MDGPGRNLTAALMCCLLVLGGSGCAGRYPSWMPFGHKPERMAGVPSPFERIEHFKQLREKAPTTGADMKAQVVQDLVKELQKEEDPILRAEILRTVAVYGGPVADSVLRAALNDPETDVRTIVCDLLGKRGDAESTKLLCGVLSGDIDKDVRMAAARALSTSRDPEAIAALGRALEDTDPAMQHRAMASLREVTGKDLGNDVDRWRTYVKNGSPTPGSPSVAERIRRWIY